MTIIRLASTALIGLMATNTALACGDSLYRAGKGIPYRTYSAPLPGNLLIFGTSEGAKQLADELSRSGHEVQIVENSDDLATQLESGNYDVVIAPYSERKAVEITGASSSFLPVAADDNEARLAKAEFNSVIVPEKHEIKHYLKAIHQELKDR